MHIEIKTFISRHCITNHSIKALVYQYVSLSVCLDDVPQLLRNGEPQRPEILRSDSTWDKEGFRLKNIRIRRTVRRKIAFAHFTLFLCHMGL